MLIQFLLLLLTLDALSSLTEEEPVSSPVREDEIFEGQPFGTFEVKGIEYPDSLTILPSFIDPDNKTTITFGDGTFTVTTGCDTITGRLILNDEGLYFRDITRTETVCEDMTVENAILEILPEINCVGHYNDSITSLYTSRTVSDAKKIKLLWN